MISTNRQREEKEEEVESCASSEAARHAPSQAPMEFDGPRYYAFF